MTINIISVHCSITVSFFPTLYCWPKVTTIGEPGLIRYYSGFVFTAYVIVYITNMFDGVLHCFCFGFTVFLVSLHGD